MAGNRLVLSLRRTAGRALGIAAWAFTGASRRLQTTSSARGRTLAGDRFVEWGWVLGHLGAEPGRVLDFGSGQGILALTAALRGHQVVAVDLEPCSFPFHEPAIEYRQGDLNELSFELGSFDQVLCCSTIEHVGLSGRYGARSQRDADLEAAGRLAALLRDGGTLLLTLPVGRDAVFAPFHRVYGAERLPQLLGPFRVLREEYRVKRAREVWEPADRETAFAEEGSASYYALGLFVLARR